MVAEISKFTQEQVRSYEDSLKYYRDLKNSLDTAEEEGFNKGIEKGIKRGIEKGKNEKAIEMAKNALKEGLSTDLIIKLTGLTKQAIEKLRK